MNFIQPYSTTVKHAGSKTLPTNNIYKRKEANALRVAEEQHYFLDITRDYLVSQFAEHVVVDPLLNLLNHNKADDVLRIEWVNLNGLHVRDMRELALCTNMCICILSNNFIKNIDSLVHCTSLIKLDLSNNQIFRLPTESFWSNLVHLQLLYLHNNPIGRLSTVASLGACRKLTALTLYDTPVSLRENYRHHVVNSIISLKVLDNYMVSDEEIIEDAKFTGHFSKFHSNLQLNLKVTTSATDYETELNDMLTLLMDINTKHAHTSPVLIIQKVWHGFQTRRYLKLNKPSLCKYNVLPSSPCSSPRFPCLPLQPSGSPGSLRQTLIHALFRSDKRVVVNESKLISNAIRLSEENEQFIDDSKAFNITWRLKTRTKAKLHSKVFSKEKKTSPGYTKEQEFSDEILELTGTQRTIDRVNKTEELNYTNRDVATDIRNQEAFFHEKTKTRTPPRKFRPVIPLSMKILARCDRSVKMSVFQAIQKAYDERDKHHSARKKAMKCCILKENRDIGVKQFHYYREDRRNKAIKECQVAGLALQSERQDKQLTRSRELSKKREIRYLCNQLHNDHKQNLNFMKEFKCYQTSLSNALRHHDIATHRKSAQSRLYQRTQEKCQDETNKRGKVHQYKKDQALMRQLETDEYKQTLNARLLEDINDRVFEAKRRVERLKTKTDLIDGVSRRSTDCMAINTSLIIPDISRNPMSGSQSAA